MAIRIIPDTTGNFLAALYQLNSQREKGLQEIASGRRVNTLSDDPSAAALSVQNRMESGETDQFLRNMSGLRAQLQVADTTMNEVVLALTRAITLGVQGANGVLSADNRLAVAQEVRGIQQQLVGLANVTFQGNYIFSGTAVTTQPFVFDGAEPSGVRYDGNTVVNSVEIATGQTLSVQLPGSQIFSDPAADVLQAIQDLITALESGTSTDVANATSQVESAFDHVNTERAFFGTTLNRLEATESFLNRERIELSWQENDLVGADLAATITNLAQRETARNALLATTARIAQLNLFDFLR
ncbi:MAG: flagellar hook-associated protein FlgL [Acidobacteria bacterium]|nr:flagellar hook-associated protein FlgL [Acidobacteriota bacterium]